MAVGVQVPPSAPSIKGAMTLSYCSLCLFFLPKNLRAVRLRIAHLLFDLPTRKSVIKEPNSVRCCSVNKMNVATLSRGLSLESLKKIFPLKNTGSVLRSTSYQMSGWSQQCNIKSKRRTTSIYGSGIARRSKSTMNVNLPFFVGTMKKHTLGFAIETSSLTLNFPRIRHGEINSFAKLEKNELP